MQVSLVYKSTPYKCEACSYEWVAIIEGIELDLELINETKFTPKIECPNCKNYTHNARV